MVRCTLLDAGKKFANDWIFQAVNYQFESGNAYAIVGANGAGKSTLLHVLSAYQSLSKGKISYFLNDAPLAESAVFQHLGWAAPYLDIVEEFTLKEFLQFHFSFKKTVNNLSIDHLIDLCALTHVQHKPIKYFSSGMKQRVKLISSICAQNEILLLDEPCTNLDLNGIEWYQQLLKDYGNNRLIIIASNRREEYTMCQHIFDINAYKTSK
ncbi:MAG: ATP-binding cassette domain-containing protein [Chitinophagales bacterium]|nr:ATP-binding cassette domain-containing protein [Bacteroidota bacterium]MCB9042159.1 ATP-binding cassette domain-containing protein [Chitinophagales bacterium]